MNAYFEQLLQPTSKMLYTLQLRITISKSQFNQCDVCNGSVTEADHVKIMMVSTTVLTIK